MTLEKSVRPNALSVICQINAISKHAINPSSDLDCAELTALMASGALKKIEENDDKGMSRPFVVVGEWAT
ncbi:hypothetical protein ACVWXL_008980 [Bradyrhizobium sp. GM22.5]